MKRTLLLAGSVAGLVVGWLAFDPPAPRHADANIPAPPTAVTGASGEGLCSDCHGGNTVNDGVGSVLITGVPNSYTPGMQYPITVTVQRTLQSRWGFELTAIKDSDQLGTGTFAPSTGPEGVYVLVRTGSIRSYVSHKADTAGEDGTFQGAPLGAWNFTWTAPAAGAGTVTFYAAGNAANGNGLNTGDFIYSTNVSSTESSTTDVSATTWGKIKKLYR